MSRMPHQLPRLAAAFTWRVFSCFRKHKSFIVSTFEPGILFGTKVETKMNLFETDSLFRCSAVRELTDAYDSEYD